LQRHGAVEDPSPVDDEDDIGLRRQVASPTQERQRIANGGRVCGLGQLSAHVVSDGAHGILDRLLEHRAIH
jgi:hypothetical protein